jgi:hypothetical protein
LANHPFRPDGYVQAVARNEWTGTKNRRIVAYRRIQRIG